jgi:hypothetical protein
VLCSAMGGVDLIMASQHVRLCGTVGSHIMKYSADVVDHSCICHASTASACMTCLDSCCCCVCFSACRSKDMCLILTNVTLVLPSADEISYLTFMSTMYNSPSPALQELAGFYR